VVIIDFGTYLDYDLDPFQKELPKMLQVKWSFLFLSRVLFFTSPGDSADTTPPKNQLISRDEIGLIIRDSQSFSVIEVVTRGKTQAFSVDVNLTQGQSVIRKHITFTPGVELPPADQEYSSIRASAVIIVRREVRAGLRVNSSFTEEEASSLKQIFAREIRRGEAIPVLLVDFMENSVTGALVKSSRIFSVNQGPYEALNDLEFQFISETKSNQ